MSKADSIEKCVSVFLPSPSQQYVSLQWNDIDFYLSIPKILGCVHDEVKENDDGSQWWDEYQRAMEMDGRAPFSSNTLPHTQTNTLP